MTFEIRLLHNRGTSTPAVARTGVQGEQIIGNFLVAPEKKDRAKMILFDLMGRLIRCVEIEEEINGAVANAIARQSSGEISFSQNAQVVEVPSVVNLRSKIESFLQAVRLAIDDVGRLVEPFYGVNYGHKLQKFRSWAQREFDEQHGFVIFANRWEPFVVRVLEMRDAVDHPKAGVCRTLHVADFTQRMDNNSVRLDPPRWWLDGRDKTDIGRDMTTIVEGIVRMQEELLALLFYQHIGNTPLVLEEIPEAIRNPECPIRLRVSIRPEVLATMPRGP